MKALAHNKLWIVGVGELADAVALMGGRDAVPNKVQFPNDRGEAVHHGAILAISAKDQIF